MTNSKLPTRKERLTPSSLFYMLLPVGLLVASVAGWIVMISIAVDDPGFAVEPDYYKKASNYDAVMEQRARNEQLGWRAELVEADAEQLTVAVVDSRRKPVRGLSGTAVAFPVARALQRQDLVFSETDQPGRYRAVLQQPRPGLWEVRLVLGDGERKFTAELRPELGGAGS